MDIKQPQKCDFEPKIKRKSRDEKSDFKPESERPSAQMGAEAQILLFTNAQAPTLGPKILFWALERPFQRPSAQFRLQLGFSCFQTLFYVS